MDIDMREKNLLLSAREEIISLRRTNEILSAKVQTMELLADFLYAKPAQHTTSEAVDVVWELTKRIDEIARMTKPIPSGEWEKKK